MFLKFNIFLNKCINSEINQMALSFPPDMQYLRAATHHHFF